MRTDAVKVTLDGVRKSFLSAGEEVEAVAEVSADISAGEFVSIVGKTGCGKTTILRLICGLIPATAGRISVASLEPDQARRRGMFSFVSQNPVLLPWRRVLENVRLPGEILKRSTRDPMTLLGLVGLEDFGSRYPHELSGGMKQRVALARALTFDPNVLLMDEPFGALDEFTREELNLLLEEILRVTPVTTVLVTHSLGEAVYLSDRVLVLTTRPARIAAVVTVPFPRPRTAPIRETAEFFETLKCLRSHLDFARS